jgi:hypothetical protein
MRWLAILVLWVAAIVVGLVILRRVRRGKPVVLTGRWSPRLVRMIAVVLVVLGAGDESAPPSAAAPAKIPVKSSDDVLPNTLNPRTVQLWLREHQEGGMYEPGNRLLLRALAGQTLDANQTVTAKDHLNRLPAKLKGLAAFDLAAVMAGKPAVAAADAHLLETLDEMKKIGRFDHAWNAYLWRKAAGAPKDPAARVRLFDHVRQHARITDALLKAYAQVKPVMLPPQAWGGKGGRPPAWAAGPGGGGPNALADILKVAGEELPFIDEGTWKRDGVALIKPVAGSPAPVVIRAGKERTLPADESTRFGRLDLLQTADQPAVVVHDWLGKIELPAHRLVSVHELPEFLSKDSKEKLDQAALDALKSNSEDAADRLERCLAVSHEAIRIGLKELPTAKGAPRLRLILSLFDDAVMPTLPVYKADPAAGQFGGAGGPGGPGGGRD